MTVHCGHGIVNIRLTHEDAEFIYGYVKEWKRWDRIRKSNLTIKP